MFGRFIPLSLPLLWLPWLCLSQAPAAVLRIELSERTDVVGGKPFGAAGPYERLAGTAYFAVDPALAANRIVTDIAKAPRNEKGLVEFHSDVYVLKPRDPARGNGAVLYEVSNRGRKGMLSLFNRGRSSLTPTAGEDFGDGFLMEQGYTLVWLGWQFDPPRTEHLMRLHAPVARGIAGLVRSEFVADRKEFTRSLADRDHVPYAVAEPNDPKLALTVRDRHDGARRPVPRSQWKIVEGTHVSMASGFEPGKIYEIVYTARDPAVVGLGPAAIRDLISFLKYGDNKVSALGDQMRFIKRAYGFGTSQSGRFLRTFLYYGFNQDEKGRKVFDGVWAHVAGGGRGSFNHRFAQPSRDGHPFLNTFYPTDIFPFSDLEQTDPETGLTDGLLSRTSKAGMTPRVFYTNSSYEYWGRSASLTHTTLDGKQDFALPETTRSYLFSGGQHGPASFPPGRSNTQNLANPNPFTWSMRALLVALDAWVKDGKEPPASQYPRIAADQLVAPAAVQFPKIPGVAFPERLQRAYRVDYGPEFRTAGIVTIEPPKAGKSFPTLVPQVNGDGQETSGIRMPGVEVALATHTGWNLRAAQIGAPDELFSMVGSWIPFPRTKAERLASKDPRLSIQERYSGRMDYLKRVELAARELVKAGYLLERDVPPLVDHSAAEWDHIHR